MNNEFFEGRLTLKSSRSGEIGVGGEVTTRSAKRPSALEAVDEDYDKAEGVKIDAPASALLSFLIET